MPSLLSVLLRRDQTGELGNISAASALNTLNDRVSSFISVLTGD